MKSLLRAVRSPATDAQESYLLEVSAFRRAMFAERMRTDRNGSPLSILLWRLPAAHCESADTHRLARTMQGRLRLTDTAGHLADGRLGLLLPDTPYAGAMKVAADLLGSYEDEPTRPNVEYIGYPDDDDQDASFGDLLEAAEDLNEIPQHRRTDAGQFFSQSLPRWKRALDVLGATVGLVATAPLVAASMLAIRLDSKGPAVFTQDREGLGGRRFRMFKLRTMRADAEAVKDALLALSEQDGPAFKIKRDPRLTRVGRILRKLSIDELPQFLNVLRGDMSLVGPRPLPVSESQECQPWQRRRLDVTPGLTCIWQVSSRSNVTFDEWVRMDLDYAANRSLKRDLGLVLATVPAVLSTKGAH